MIKFKSHRTNDIFSFMTTHPSNFCITVKKAVIQIPVGTRQVTYMRLGVKMRAQGERVAATKRK